MSNNNNSGSSNSLMVTLIVIVIIALGILFFLKPFNHTETTPATKVDVNKSVEIEDVDTILPDENDQTTPAKKNGK